MASKTKILSTLAQYFETKGRVLKASEYARETDTPIRIQQIRNIFGCWNRMEKLIMAKKNRDGLEAITDVNEILEARNRALEEDRQQWIKASENQDEKARREAEALQVAEKLARNAATPEGANANKIAIGGQLPGEQPDYTKIGATVKIDPVTKEQTVVDPQPEIIEPEITNPKTPEELKEVVEPETGDVETGKETSGGSTGTASNATANALDKTDTKVAADKK